MRRHVVSLLLAVACVIAATPPMPVVAVQDDGLCRLLTAKEVRTALGKGRWQIAEDGDVPEQCYMHNGLLDRKSRAFSMRLLASNQDNQAEFRDDLVASGATELTIAGFPAVQDDRDAVTIFFPDPWDMLQLSPVGYEGQDVARRIRQLAELAAGRYASPGEPSPAASPPAPSAGSDVAADPCALLTAEEISAALGGEPLSVSDQAMSGHCTYLNQVGTFFEVAVDVAPDADISMIELRRLLMPEVTDLEVAGLPALAMTSAGSRSQTVMVYPTEAVELTFSLQTTAGADAMPALTALAELGTARALQAGLPEPSVPVPTAGAASGGGLCDIVTLTELTAALGDDTVAVGLGGADQCVWSTAVAPVGVSLEIKVGDEAASVRQQLAMMPSTFEVAGMTAAQGGMPPADGMVLSGIVLLPDDTRAVLLTVVTPEAIDVAAAARTIAELIAPRLGDYLDR